MAIKRPKPEEIVVKLRQVEVLMGQGVPRMDAIRQFSVTEQTYLGNGFPINGSRLAFVFSSGFGFFDSFALSLTNQVPFKFSDCTEYLHH